MKLKKILLIIISTGILATIVLILPLVLAFGKSGRETTILGRDYATLNKKQIVEKINEDFDFNTSIRFASNDRIFEIKLASISAQINTNKMASSLLYRSL